MGACNSSHKPVEMVVASTTTTSTPIEAKISPIDISKINSVKTVLESSNESDKDSADGQITSRSDISLVPVSPKPEESLSSSQENSDSDGETNNNIIVPDDEIPLPGAVPMNDYTNDTF